MTTFPRWLRLLGAVMVLGLFGHPPEIRAGGSANDCVGVEKFGDASIRDLALKLNDELDHRHVNVAIVARAGRSRAEMPRGINYTHVAFAVFEPVRDADGAVRYTYTFYNLYQGANGRDDRSYLKQDDRDHVQRPSGRVGESGVAWASCP